MKINRNSWHNWLYMQGGGNSAYNTNLCSYVNRVALGLVKWPFLVLFSPFIGLFLFMNWEPKGGPPIMIWLMLLGALFGLGWADLLWFKSSYTLSAIIVHAAVVLLVTLLVLKSDVARIFREWVKAKHQRVCPIVEFTNE